MEICFEGVGQAVATFLTEEELLPGQAVTLTGSGTVGLGESGGPVCGVTVSASRNGAVAVQIGGAVKVGCSNDSAPAVGYAVLACDGKGCVEEDKGEGNGAVCLVLAVDTAEKTAVIKL